MKTDGWFRSCFWDAVGYWYQRERSQELIYLFFLGIGLWFLIQWALKVQFGVFYCWFAFHFWVYPWQTHTTLLFCCVSVRSVSCWTSKHKLSLYSLLLGFERVWTVIVFCLQVTTERPKDSTVSFWSWLTLWGIFCILPNEFGAKQMWKLYLNKRKSKYFLKLLA